ncbi:helix-turn-helix transcriptional regulator [Actinomadura oligospora]|uniref:helix-turn-helix transcriptional regulator n=1 Tax=Actinomadura oligospora TaxID=111804 RepID=UPI00047D45F1|nr:LuxR C-terminal-related transcriptional regulator [Actinomadura oligospora]
MTGLRVTVVSDDLLLGRGMTAVLDGLPIVAAVRLVGTAEAAEARGDDAVVVIPAAGSGRAAVPHAARMLILLDDPSAATAEPARPSAPDETPRPSAADGPPPRPDTADGRHDIDDGAPRPDAVLPVRGLRADVLEATLRRLCPRPAPSETLLSERERETLGHLADGLTNRQIARRMGISEHGVKRHIAMIMARLGCANRTSAVTTAIRYGIIDARRTPGRRAASSAPPCAATSTAVP